VRQPSGAIADWIIVVYYGTLIAVSLFGLVGSLLRRPNLVSVYNVTSWMLLFLDLVGVIFSVHNMYSGGLDQVRRFPTRSASGWL
jgi:hypothetical protein